MKVKFICVNAFYSLILVAMTIAFCNFSAYAADNNSYTMELTSYTSKTVNIKGNETLSINIYDSGENMLANSKIGSGKINNMGTNVLLSSTKVTRKPTKMIFSFNNVRARGKWSADITFTVTDDSTKNKTVYTYSANNMSRGKSYSVNLSNTGYTTFEIDPNHTEVAIPDGIKTIGYGLFRDYDNITSVLIPDSVESIGDEAFYNCKNLRSITIGENSNLSVIGKLAFSQCKSLESISIPSKVSNIGSYAFNKCTSLSGIAIPSSVSEIGDYAFSNCSELKTVYCTINSPVRNNKLYSFAPSFVNIGSSTNAGSIIGSIDGSTIFILFAALILAIVSIYSLMHRKNRIKPRIDKDEIGYKIDD